MFAISVRVVFTLFGILEIFVSVVLSSGTRCDKYAEYGDFTHQVSLRDDSLYHRCGGALISDRWALSTASCYSDSIQFMAVGVFSLDEADIYVVDSIKIHEQFDESTGINDIALFRTNRAIQLSQYAQPIPYLNGPTAACDANLVVVGWRDTGGLAQNNWKLRYVNFTAVKNEECETLIQGQGYEGFTINPTSICTITENTNGVYCLGYFCQNSMKGLPLSSSEYRILIGILPIQRDCGYTPIFAIRVSNYADWIFQYTNVVGVDAMEL